MEKTETSKYREWLKTISNSMLIFNSSKELAEYLNRQGIENNGVSKSYKNDEDVRSAINDLRQLVREKTNGYLELDGLMERYKKTSAFFMEKLKRKKYAGQLAEKILLLGMPDFCYDDDKKSTNDVLKTIHENGYDVVILALMLLNAWGSYVSKGGDIKDFESVYDKVVDFVRNLDCMKDVVDYKCFKSFENENDKSRLMLYYHLSLIVKECSANRSSVLKYYEIKKYKEGLSDIDVDGWWNESGGGASTDFWHFKCRRKGDYQAVHVVKTESEIVVEKYGMLFYKKSDGTLRVVMTKPEYIEDVINNKCKNSSNFMCYDAAQPESQHVDKLIIKSNEYRKGWQSEHEFSRVKSLEICRNFADLYKGENHDKEIFAITKEAVYIRKDDVLFYKIPRRDRHYGFYLIGIEDEVGVYEFCGRQYFVFDELGLYFPVEKMAQYGIEVTDKIE